MKNKRKVLRTSLFTLSAILTLTTQSLKVNAYNTKTAENKYRLEHHIDEDVELINLDNTILLKMQNESGTKYYLCSVEYDYYDKEITQDSIHKLFQNTPSEMYLNKNSTKYARAYHHTRKFTDLLDDNNIFTINTESIDIYDGIPSNKNAELVCWGDINTYSQTITNDMYTEYYSFDVSTQKSSTQYETTSKQLVSICRNKEEILEEYYKENYIIKDDLETVMSSLNGEIYIRIKEK